MAIQAKCNIIVKGLIIVFIDFHKNNTSNTIANSPFYNLMKYFTDSSQSQF